MPKPSKTHEQLDFEIAFYEQLLHEHPDFTDALMALGEANTRRGWHEKGLAIDQQLTHLRTGDAVVWYNLACSYSLLGRIDEALGSLRRAIGLGYDDFEHLGKDPDLLALRQSHQFRRFLETFSSASP